MCTKKGELVWPIARKKNVIIPRLATSVTVWVFNLIHDYKFHGDLKRLDNFFFLKLDDTEINYQLYRLQVSRTLKTRKAITWGFKSQTS